MARRTLIIAPPMTPNGDLHVGHLSGPYLAADVYKRHIAQHGVTAWYVLSSDDNQSYVDTSAARLGTSPNELIATSRAEVRDTLAAYALGVDLFGSQNAAYIQYVKGYFKTLYEAGVLQVTPVDVLFEHTTNTYPVESFVSGYCPNCLDRTCGGICEGCGHPNGGTDLLGLDPRRYEVRREPRLVLDLEACRPELERYLMSMPTHRSALRRLIRQLLAKPMAPFIASYRLERGISADFVGLPDQKLNVWAEMYAGHLYFLKQCAGDIGPDDDYVQFLGFDNSYFYVFVHVALALASRRLHLPVPQPSAFVTNQFYYLDTAKFSTSKRHLIWARDMARDYSADAIRLFLALHGPEFQEASFLPGRFAEIASGLAEVINRLVRLFNARRSECSAQPQPFPQTLIDLFAKPVPLAEFSMATLARKAMNVVEYAGDRLEAGDLSLLPYVPSALKLWLEPFCPGYSAALGTTYPHVHSVSPPPVAAADRPLPLLSLRPRSSTSSASDSDHRTSPWQWRWTTATAVCERYSSSKALRPPGTTGCSSMAATRSTPFCGTSSRPSTRAASSPSSITCISPAGSLSF